MKIPLEAIAFVLSELEGPSAAEAFSKHIEKGAELADVDPLHLMAYVDHESHFVRYASSRDGEDVGIGQVRLRYQPACRDGIRTESCKEERKRLFDPAYNLRVLAGKIRSAKRLPTYQSDPRPERWLASLAGSSDPNQRRVREIMRIHARLLRSLEKWRAANSESSRAPSP